MMDLFVSIKNSFAGVDPGIIIFALGLFAFLFFLCIFGWLQKLYLHIKRNKINENPENRKKEDFENSNDSSSTLDDVDYDYDS